MKAFRVPYTVALVLVGLVVGLAPKHAQFGLTPHLVLFVFLPALLFAGAWGLPIDHLRRNFVPIALFATAGVAVGIAVSFAVLHFGGGISVDAALLFGAMVAATDPVAVLALFRSMRVDRDLSTIVEGESLFNDGTAVVAFRALLAGMMTGGTVDSGALTWSFVFVMFGGAGVGALGGFVLRYVLHLFGLHRFVFLAASFVVAYGVYDVAELLSVSGIIAVLCCGLVIANAARSLADGDLVATQSDRFWEGVAFIANAALFVLIGLSVNVGDLTAAWPATGWAILAAIVGRAVTVYGLAPISRLLGQPLPARWQHVMAVGGLRGALSMALALSLPPDVPQRELLITMVYSAVIFTLVVQGVSVQWAVPRPERV